MNAYLLGGSLAVLVLVAIVFTLVVVRVRRTQRRKELESLLKRYQQSRLALVRFVMLNRQCSEEIAYQRLATFVKNHVSSDYHSSIDRVLAQDRESLIDSVQRLLAHDPDEIDKI